jgi:enoyl-CoA hydratase/carnithine racemase
MQSSPESPLAVSVEDGIATLTLNRPEVRNAIDSQLREALAAALDEAAVAEDVKAVILTGAGGNFCAGGDLGSFEELHDPRTYRYASHRLTELGERIERLEKPVVAAIEGVVTGAGLSLALASDWRLAGPQARFLFREGRLGLIPTHGGLTRLVKLLGLARAKEVLLGGDDLDVERAATIGLVSERGGAEELPAVAVARLGKMLARAPLSFGAAKRLLGLAADTDQHSSVLAEGLAQSFLLASADHHEGLAAARERRRPIFQGR